MQFGLTYSATCQTYWVIWNFPVLSPGRDTLCFAQKNCLNHQFNNLEREIQLDPRGSRSILILLIIQIYGWLGWTNPIKWSIQAPFRKYPVGNPDMITTCILNDYFITYRRSQTKLPINEIILITMTPSNICRKKGTKCVEKKSHTKKSGIGIVCPICTNWSRADLYPE